MKLQTGCCQANIALNKSSVHWQPYCRDRALTGWPGVEHVRTGYDLRVSALSGFITVGHPFRSFLGDSEILVRSLTRTVYVAHLIYERFYSLDLEVTLETKFSLYQSISTIS